VADGPAYKADTAAADAKPVSHIAWREFFADARLRR
jgi:multidrug efflux system outer membrane protein